MIARLLTLAASAVALTAAGVAAQPPAGVDIVPKNAAAFATIKVSDLWDSDQLKPAREVFAKDELKVLQGVEKVFGVAPAEIERVTAFWPVYQGGTPPFLVVTTRKPFNEAKLLRSLHAVPVPSTLWGGDPFERGFAVPPQTKESVPVPKSPVYEKKLEPDPCAPGDDQPAADARPFEDLYYLRDGRPYQVMSFVDDRTILFLPAGERGANYAVLVTHLLKKNAKGPLATALNESAKHTVVVAGKVPPLESFEFALPPQLVPFRALVRAKVVALTADVGATAKLNVTATFADAAAAKRAEPVLKTLIQMGEEELAAARKTLPGDAEYASVLQPLLELAAKTLNKAEVKADGATVTAATEADLGPVVAKAVAAAPQVILAASERTRTQNNLKQIGLAIHNYHDAMGQMPTDVLDATGKPILSWRVQILPYLEQDHLYRQIDMKKPWDDPVNKRLLETTPEVFRVYGRDPREKGMTYLQMPSADKPSKEQPYGDPFKVPGMKRNFASITDGTSNTFMVVEAEDPVLWMKPEDVKYDPKNLPKLGAPNRSTFQVLRADGSVWAFQRKSLDEATLRAFLTINGGEVINYDR